MSEQQLQPIEEGTKARPRERSTIAFPYVDLDGARDVVLAINQNGGTHGDFASLAAWMGHGSVNSGTFRNKVSAARIYSLVEVDKGEVQLTDLGRQIVDPQREVEARAKAFRRVPLFDRIFTQFEGHMLPAPVAIENEMRGLGVPQKQTGKARQVLMRAAEQAGYFASGDDRLTTPSVLFQGRAAEPAREEQDDSKAGGDGNGRLPGYTYPLKHSDDSITVSLSRDVLRLSKDDRDFVLEVITKLEGYKDSGFQNETIDAPTEAGTGSL